MILKFIPVVGAVLALAIAAAEPAPAYPAGSKPDITYLAVVQHAARNDACVTARQIFRANMDEARFWMGAADRLAAAGNETLANQATDEANFYLGRAGSALKDMTSSC
jgi:predicted Zn-dependent protease